MGMAVTVVLSIYFTVNGFDFCIYMHYVSWSKECVCGIQNCLKSHKMGVIMIFNQLCLFLHVLYYWNDAKFMFKTQTLDMVICLLDTKKVIYLVQFSFFFFSFFCNHTVTQFEQEISFSSNNYVSHHLELLRCVSQECSPMQAESTT